MASSPIGSLRYLYEPLVEATAASQMGVEVSSQGLLRTIGEIYPAPELLKMFHSAGVPIMLASDAHVPDESAFGYSEIIAEARRAGYTDYLRFDSRQRLVTPLPVL